MNEKSHKMPMLARRCFACAGVVGALFLSGCMVGPKYQKPPAVAPQAYHEPLPEGYKGDPNWKPASPNDAVVRGKWWTIFNDPELDALEEQVNVSNQNLRTAEAQYRQALDLVRSARSALFPTLSTGGSVVNSQSSGTIYGGNQLAALVQQRTVYQFPIQLSYQADLWGSIRRNINANVASAQATAAQLENARLSYQAALAMAYFELHGVDGDQDLLERTVKSYRDFLQLTRDRFSAGVASDSDVAQAETQLNTTQAQLIDVGLARDQYEHAIAVLTGRPPSGFSIPRRILKNPPPPIPVALPSALLERRPDIAAAERQMAVANEAIGIAMAAYYPTISLSGTMGLQTSRFTDWFTWPSRFWSVGPTASETILDFGRRRAQVSQAKNAWDAAVSTYRQTVLNAFQQVEDQLAAIRILSNEAQAQAAAVQSAERALDLSTLQYKAGTTDYLQVITTQTTALSNERTAIQLLTRQITASVGLIQAVGGGWDSSTLPSRDTVLHGQ